MDNPYATPAPGSDFDHLDAISRQGPCATCGHPEAQEVTFMWVMSFLFFTRHVEYAGHLCRKCATKTALADFGKSALLGWWGIPWGLLTFKALWINTRTLMRWSTLPSFVGLLIGLAGIAPIVGIAAWIVFEQRAEQHARSTGNWVDQAVVELVAEGHRAFDEGDLNGSMKAYRRALFSAPESSIINFSIAGVYSDAGAPGLALPYIERAEEIEPDDTDSVALHASILIELDQADEAKEVAGRLMGITPDDEYRAVDIGYVFSSIGEPAEALRVCNWGFERNSEYWPLKYCILEANLDLNEVEEMETLAAKLLSEEEAAFPAFSYLRDVRLMQSNPDAALPTILEEWAFGVYGNSGIDRILRAASVAGASEHVRERMRAWLFEETTPDVAWAAARPLFDDQSWPEALDRRLEAGEAVVPAVLRAWTLDQVEDRPRRQQLVSRTKEADHPWSNIAAATYFADLSRTVPIKVYDRQLRDYLDRHPDDAWCRYLQIHDLAVRDSDAADQEFRKLAESADESELEAVLARYGRAYVAVARGDIQQARILTESLPLGGSPPFLDAEDILYLQTEVAILAGDSELVREFASLMDRIDSSTMRSYAMVLRWIDAYGRGVTPIVQQDVARWLDREDLAQLRQRPSTVIQALLLTEGLIDRRWLNLAVGTVYPETAELIELLRNSGDGSALDAEKLAAIADSEKPNAWGPRWARFLLKKTGTS